MLKSLGPSWCAAGPSLCLKRSSLCCLTPKVKNGLEPTLLLFDLYRVVGLEGTFEGHLVQLPCNEQEHLLLDQVAQSPV